MASTSVLSALPPTQGASMLPEDRFRGAVVEDLQLPPAFTLPANESISRALELAYERDFSQIPVLDKHRRPLGYVDTTALKAKWEAGYAKPNDSVKLYMSKFIRNASHPYTVITPDTPLAELAEFLRRNIFAIVTDSQRKFVLAVATSQDLENFLSRWGTVTNTAIVTHTSSDLFGVSSSASCNIDYTT